MYCKICGREINETAKYCKFCGADILNDDFNENYKKNMETSNGAPTKLKRSRYMIWGIIICIIVAAAFLAGYHFIDPFSEETNQKEDNKTSLTNIQDPSDKGNLPVSDSLIVNTAYVNKVSPIGNVINCTWPQITGMSNKEFQNNINDTISSYQEEFENYFYNTYDYEGCSMGGDYEIVYQDDERISIIISPYIETGGEPDGRRYSINIDFNKQKIVDLNDMASSWNQLTEMMMTEMQNNPDKYSELYEGALPYVNETNLNNFYFIKDGICIYFDPYVLGPRSEGYVTFDLLIK